MSFDTLPLAVGEASRWLNEDAELDRVMILPAEDANLFGRVYPKFEGKTGFVRCHVMMADDWHVVTRANIGDSESK